MLFFIGPWIWVWDRRWNCRVGRSSISRFSTSTYVILFKPTIKIYNSKTSERYLLSNFNVNNKLTTCGQLSIITYLKPHCCCTKHIEINWILLINYCNVIWNTLIFILVSPWKVIHCNLSEVLVWTSSIKVNSRWH